MARRPPARAPQEKPFRISGFAAVSALFARDPQRVERLYFEPQFQIAAAPFCKIMAQQRKLYRQVGAEELAKIAGTVLTGGIVAISRPRPVEPFNVDTFLRSPQPLLALDGVSNPHNLGAIVRTLAFFGVERLILTDHPEQATPSESAYRVAEGGFEYVALSRIDSTPETLQRLQKRCRVIGTAPDRKAMTSSMLKDDPKNGNDARPALIVLGNEERGLRPNVLAACSETLTIPGAGWVQSLNVAATAAILIYNLLLRSNTP
ncbi:RNA methyltransferase, TrmH family [Azospirillaceae bacterium]